MRRAVPAIAAVLALALVVGCGGDDDSEEPAEQGSQPQQEAKQGGDLTVMYAADVDKIDPGQTYYQYGMNVAYATQRPLYSYKPDDAKNLEPDLAEGPPEIAADGTSVTVKIRTGVKFSPPVDREVTSADVKYGARARLPAHGRRPYVGAYMGSLKGLKAYQSGDAKEITGIKTPDDQTIVLELDAPRGAIVAAALSMPASAPVPKEYARSSTSDSRRRTARTRSRTGPYMVENDESGKLTGYTPGTEIKLVRNPNWDATTDYKPAYLDSITIKEGNEPEVASQQILEGQGMVSGDFQLPAAIPQERLDGRPEGPDGADRRRPAASATSRSGPTGRRSTTRTCGARSTRRSTRRRCGRRSAARSPATSRRTTSRPGQPGFEEAGGDEGTGADFMAQPKGNLELAKEYMKKAGYESGMYDGAQLSGVSDNATQQKNVTQVAVRAVQAARLRHRHAVRRARLDVHEVLPGAGQPA